jgi:hypothetical protein
MICPIVTDDLWYSDVNWSLVLRLGDLPAPRINPAFFFTGSKSGLACGVGGVSSYARMWG